MKDQISRNVKEEEGEEEIKERKRGKLTKKNLLFFSAISNNLQNNFSFISQHCDVYNKFLFVCLFVCVLNNFFLNSAHFVKKV